MKTKTTLLINKKLIEKAKDLGINLSRAFEKTLENLTEAMEKAYSTEKAKSFLGEASLEKKVQRGCPSLVGGRPAKPVVSNGRAGSNPAPRAFLACYSKICLTVVYCFWVLRLDALRGFGLIRFIGAAILRTAGTLLRWL